MIKILRSYGIPDKIVNAIEASYASTRAKVYIKYIYIYMSILTRWFNGRI